jgi:hypothetical protein
LSHVGESFVLLYVDSYFTRRCLDSGTKV